MAVHDYLYLAIALPLISAIGCVIFRNKQNLRDGLTLLVAVVLFINILMLFSINEVHIGKEMAMPVIHYVDIFPNMSISFKVDRLSLIFALVASGLWILTTLYAIGYMRGNRESHQSRFFAFFAISISTVIGLAFANNLFCLFLFYEAITLATFPLVTHNGDRSAWQAGKKYLAHLLGSSVALFLIAMIWTYIISGTLDFTDGGILPEGTSDGVMITLLLMYIYGVGKAGVMPMHRWLPAAMVAPTPVSALLHAVAVVKAGVFTIIKIVIFILGSERLAGIDGAEIGMYLAGTTIIVASIFALRQNNLKARLAYSTISQLSYIVMAVCIFTPMAIIAAIFHIVAHAVSKITLFFAAGAIYTANKKKYISELDGIGRSMPITMIAFTIGALSMIGIPPLAGFITKGLMIDGADSFFPLIVLVISTILNCLYFLPIILRAFIYPKQDGLVEAKWQQILPIIITATLTILVFIYAYDIIRYIRGA